MAELVLSDLNAGVLNQLQERADSHGRTPEEEAKAILAAALRAEPSAPWAAVNAIYHNLSTVGRAYSDSAELLREDRDR